MCCSVLQCVAVCCSECVPLLSRSGGLHWKCNGAYTDRRAPEIARFGRSASNGTHCNSLQHTATQCNTLQHTATPCNSDPILQFYRGGVYSAASNVAHCNTLQHTATRCNTMQHTATHCTTLQHTATHCNTLQITATHCNTLQQRPNLAVLQGRGVFSGV